MDLKTIPNGEDAYVIAKLGDFYDRSQFQFFEILRVEMLKKKDLTRKAAALRKIKDLESRLCGVKTKKDATNLALEGDWLSMASCDTSRTTQKRIKELEKMLSQLKDTKRVYNALPQGEKLFAIVSYDDRKERQKADNESHQRIYFKHLQREDANPCGPMELDYSKIENPPRYQIGDLLPRKAPEGIEIRFADSLKNARDVCATYSRIYKTATLLVELPRIMKDPKNRIALSLPLF